jgi:hypothetical protein
MALEQLRAAAVHQLRAGCVVLLGAVAHFGATLRIAALILCERLRVPATVFVRLAERKAQRRIVARMAAARGGGRRHRRQLLIREVERLQVGKTPPRIAKQRIER